MDIGTFTQLIGAYGFPIFSCVAMGWYVKYITDKNREEIKAIRTEHQKEMQEVTTALNNNTLAIQKLCDRIGGESIEH